jgi:DNA polymerase III sliding clamp (beta) subunit (PCNA family)
MNTEKTSSITITTAQLEAALLFAAKKDIRYQFNGLFFKPAANVLWATDGHRAIEIKTPDASGSAEFIIDRALCELALKLAKAGKAKLIAIEYSQESKQGTIHNQPFIAVDGRYPDISVIFPDAKNALLSAGVRNADYYRDACKAAMLLECSVHSRVPAIPFYASVEIKKDDTPQQVIYKTTERINFFYSDACRIAIMPIRI